MSETRLQITDCQGKHLGFADGICSECETAYNADHECECGTYGGTDEVVNFDGTRHEAQESLGLPPGRAPEPQGDLDPLVAALRALGIPVPGPATPRGPRFAWIKPILSMIKKHLHGAVVWSLMLGVLFADKMTTSPSENPLSHLIDFPALDDLPWNVIRAGVIVLVYTVWAIFVTRRPKIENKL